MIPAMVKWLIGLLAAVFSSSLQAQEITVSAAVSLRDALTEIAQDYERETGTRVVLNFGASGRLAQQIVEGAPVDLFIAAAESQMQRLRDAGRADPDDAAVIARNALVVIVPANARFMPQQVSELTDPRLRRIAVGQPAVVPAGEYAMAALARSAIADTLRGRLVQGTNVRQVLDYVAREEVEAGIVYATDARAAGERVRVAFMIESSLHDPIVYPAAVVAGSRQSAGARSFLQYLQSDGARKRFAAHGFAPPMPTTRPAAP